MQIPFVQDCDVETDQFLAHKIFQTTDSSNKPRFLCTACGRSGNWSERSRFLQFSCAGQPESKAEAMSRHRIQQERLKHKDTLVFETSPLPLGERALVFADAFRTILRHSNSNFQPLVHATAVCRALKGHSLPPTAGLLVRPLLLCQSTISEEISKAAHRFHVGECESASQRHLSWFPAYDKLPMRPEPLWRSREPD